MGKSSSLSLAPAPVTSTITVTARTGTVNQAAHGKQTAHKIAPSYGLLFGVSVLAT